MKLLGIELEPVTRLTWNSLGAQQYWQPRVEQINALYWQVERETVVRGMRDCNVWTLTSESYSRDLREITEQGLHFVPVRTVKAHQGFSHKHEELPEGARDAHVYGVVCQDLAKGKAFRDAHHARPVEHHLIGSLLGYPSCCIEFFQREWADNRFIDPIWQQAMNTVNRQSIDEHTLRVQGDPRCNVILRYFGIRLCPLLPHSFDCAECARFVQTWLDLAMELDPDTTTDLLTLLEMPVEWNAFKGLGIIHTPIFRGHVNTVACYPRHVVRYEAKDPQYFDYATFPHPSKGLGWPYEQFSANALLSRLTASS